jgi:hypothetical protein
VFVPAEFALTTDRSHGRAGLAEPELRYTDASLASTGSNMVHVRQSSNPVGSHSQLSCPLSGSGLEGWPAAPVVP